ncbi:MAG TPA: response regulator transcription factor [Leptolyngbyaceae cyanobacterium M33_DOE_097]|uniref:Response regulator transcription factor n=1 Tax=Oscillatoriales cyanobacterium SpSt-418 TaxID=2282169 RepID=A0A7C3KDG5_9CYAN|nr:response regulator transcription factor [Leptolyngbyaceae cyanobacterium M33_DOE_097]
MADVRIVLIEDHDLTRVGMRTALQQYGGFEVVGEAAEAQRGLEVLTTTKPDVAIVDIGLPKTDGVELTRRFRQIQAEENDPALGAVKVLILTLQDHEDVVLAAFAAGADSYCMKDVRLEHLAEALRTTYEGNAWIDPAIARIVLQQARKSSPVEELEKVVAIQATAPEYQQMLETYPLTERELEVLQLIVDGHSNAEIADKLFITIGTVKTHVRNILNKLCADDRTQAAVRALRTGLVG